MKNVIFFLTSPPAILVISTLLIGAAIWFYGPLIPFGDGYPLEPVLARLVVLGGLLALISLIVLIALWRRHRRSKALAAEMAGADEDGDQADPDAPARAELAEVQSRLREALTTLSKTRLEGKRGRNRLYQLPWYLIIGPPGTGKTTAIVNSGLKFPLADKLGKNAVGGVGGTRNCDWWFTNDAVLIDTAGRYTTQESDADTDARAWTGFLDMLKKYRPRQPINGVLVAVSLSDLSLLGPGERHAHAHAIRKRLRELRERLGVRLPVYVVFTKADLIAGFQEFFDDLGREERAQVWGFTLAQEGGGASADPLAGFDAEFDALLARLNSRGIERMQAETDPRRRSLVHGFAQQVASLKPVAREFLGEIFQESRFEERPFMRGVYLTSGTQEGTPIDRLMRGMAQTFGIGRQSVGTGQGQGRSYFLTRLLTNVVFGEAGLVSADDRVERRYRWIRRGSVAAGVLLVVGFAALWTRSYLGNTDLIAEAEARVATYQSEVDGLQVNPVRDTDLLAVLPALESLRALPGNPALGDEGPPENLTWGLYQGDRIGSEAAQSYRAALNRLFLPRLLLRLENQLAANLDKPDLLYEGLKVYLMLGLEGPLDADTVTGWMTADWFNAYPGAANAEVRAALIGHLEQLVSQPMQKLALNGPLVARVQGILAETPLAQRIYRGIIESPDARDLPDWRVTAAGGPSTTRAILRPSGTPLSEGVPGIHTRRGFHEVFLPEALQVAERLRRESWVLGSRGVVEPDQRTLSQLARDVVNLYYQDYVTAWDRILGDIDIVPLDSLSHAVEVTNILSGPTSPIRNILESVAEETRLTQPPEKADTGLPVDADAAGSAVGDFAKGEFLSGLDPTVRGLVDALRGASPAGGGEAGEAPVVPGQYVEDHFSWLHGLVASEEGAPSQLDQVIERFGAVYSSLNRMAPGSGVQPPQGEGSAAQRLVEQTQRLPGPLSRWAAQVAEGSSGIAAGGARAQLNRRWQAQVLPFCRQAIEGRYPFDRTARADVTLRDFARLFAPQGMIDSFFREHLTDFVDTTQKPWTWRSYDGADLGIPDSVLTQFQDAADIRDSFFLGAGPPSIGFSLKPVALDGNISSVTLEVEGQPLEYAHGPQQLTPMTWPGQAGGRTRIAYLPQQAGTANSISKDGPWAWFRLLDAAEIRRTNVSDRSRVVFDIGGRLSIFELRAGSALNPFQLQALRSFRCVRAL